MTGITRFDDIDGLVTYYNAHEAPPTVQGTNVLTWPAVYGSEPVDLTALGTVRPQYSPGSNTIGLMDGVYFSPSSDGYLEGDFTTNIPATQPITTVVLQQIDVGHLTGYALELRTTNSGTAAASRIYNGKHYYSVRGSTYNSGQVVPDDAQVLTSVLDTDTEDTSRFTHTMYINTTPYTGNGGAAGTVDTNKIWLGNRSSGSSPIGGILSIVAVYDRALSAAEVTLVYDLIYHWVFNAAPPTGGNPLSGSFSATSSDPDSTFHWECNRSDVPGDDWYPVDDPTNGLSNTSTTNGGSTLNIVSAQSSDTGGIICRVTTPTNSEGVYSNASALLVEGGGVSIYKSLDAETLYRILQYLRSRGRDL